MPLRTRPAAVVLAFGFASMQVLGMALLAQTARAETFSNPAAIAIPATGTTGAASPYPSDIVVSGIEGRSRT